MGESTEKNVGGADGVGKFGFKVKLNRQDREFRVCLTRATAGVGLAAVCGILVGVVATVRHVSNQGPEAARADIREIPLIPSGKGPAKSAAKQNGSAKATTTATKPATPAKPPAPPVALAPTKPALVTTATPAPASVAQRQAAKTAEATKTTPATQPTTSAAEGRTVGQQYLVLGSYPNQAEAKAAVEKLGRAGVACTAEKSLPGWTRKGWYSVVTVNGYASQDRAFAKQVKALEAKGYEAAV